MTHGACLACLPSAASLRVAMIHVACLALMHLEHIRAMHAAATCMLMQMCAASWDEPPAHSV